MQRSGIRNDPAGSGQPSCGWNDTKSGDGFLGSHGRVFDIVVVGRPGATATSPHMGTLETALFESGGPSSSRRPRLPTDPRRGRDHRLERQHRDGARHRLAKPLLKKARAPSCCRSRNAGVPGPDGEPGRAPSAAERHRLRGTVVQRGSRSAGAAILEEATRFGSDLIVKGAFTQSRLRQMIFGGATSHLINETTLPVLMAHERSLRTDTSGEYRRLAGARCSDAGRPLDVSRTFEAAVAA